MKHFTKVKALNPAEVYADAYWYHGPSSGLNVDINGTRFYALPMIPCSSNEHITLKQVPVQVRAYHQKSRGNTRRTNRGQAGRSGHLSSSYISDIKIDEIKEKIDTIEVQVTYTIDVLSEFDYAEETDSEEEPIPVDPFHYKKTDKLIIE